VELVARLNEIGGLHGVGRIDLVEDRMIGMKSRGVYETPGGTLLYAAHSELEQMVLDRRTLAAKDLIAPRYADLVYEGRWWTTEREAYDAFVNVTQERVTGTVTLQLYKGSLTVVGRESAHALYDERFVTFGEDDVYQQSDAAGYIRLFGLSQRVRAIRDAEAAAAASGTGSGQGTGSGSNSGSVGGAPSLRSGQAPQKNDGAGEPAARHRNAAGGDESSSEEAPDEPALAGA
jgi:argininosuccinate synthase